MRFKHLFLILLMAGLISSCGDDDDEEVLNYSVTIMSPDNTDKKVGDEIHIHVNFDEADLKVIHNVSVTVKNVEDDSVFYSYEEHVHDESGHFEHHHDLILDVEAHSDMILEAKVWPHDADDGEHHEGEEHEGEHHEESTHGLVKSSVEFHVHPN